MSPKVKQIHQILIEAIDSTPKRVAVYFKTGQGDYAEHDQFMGVRVPSLRKIAKSLGAVDLSDLSILIRSKFNEERLLALILLIQQFQQGSSEEQTKIYHFYRTNLSSINNWNLVDASAHHIVGAYLFDKDRAYLEELSQSSNLWERRISIVATWYFIRQKDLDWTFKLAKLLINDSHDLMHKAVGWMLREAGKKNEAKLREFLLAHQASMPKTMLRYARERLV